MRKLTNKEFLEGKAFRYAIDHYFHTIDCFISTYKDYGYCISNFYNSFSIMNIAIFKLTKQGNIIKVYENDNSEDIIKLFGKNFKSNNVDTVRRKVADFIKVNLED